MTLMALGMLPKAHPLSLGMLGMHGARSTNFILQQADLLIVLGARFDDRATGKVAEFCPNAKIIHVDIDRAELGKIKQAHIAIQADVDDVLTQLLPQIDAQTCGGVKLQNCSRNSPALFHKRATRSAITA
jgi:acetolactate synthase-1/2/3 large subunit